MARVFLSYATEDGEAASKLAGLLRERDQDVFLFQNPATRGDRFVPLIAERIRDAGVVIVLMSPHYLASAWCRRESELAIQRQAADPGLVIRVLQVAPTRHEDSGFLGAYDWIEFHPPYGHELPVPVLTALGSAEEQAPGLRPVGFRNRDEEVAKVRHALELTTGQDFWVVVAPPRLGKTWFLRHLHDHLAAASDGGTVRLLDLHGLADAWSKPARVLALLLDVEIGATRDVLTDEQIRDVVRKIVKRRRQFYLLDSADRMDRSTTAEVRRVLTHLHRRLGEHGNGSARFGVVVGTRQHDDWKGYRFGASTRFEPVTLSEFTPEVVDQVVRSYDPLLTPADTRACALLLHRLSEGLPALLVRWVEWAEDRSFYALDEEAEDDAVFDAVTRPYVDAELLDPEVLFARGHQDPRRCVAVLDRALKALVVYRLITRSHLVFHFDADEELRSMAADIGWQVDDLWIAITRTTLLESDLPEMWQEISRPIRRVLYRYYFRSDPLRSSAHREARACYERWSVKQAAKEQVVMMVECLWHEMSRQLLEQRSELPAELPRVAGELAREFLSSTLYSPGEFARFIANRLGRDAEFQLALSGFDGLFDAVLLAIDASLSEGG